MSILTPPSPIYKSNLRQSKLNNLPNPQQNPLASLSAAFIFSLFNCPLHSTNYNSPSLDNFIAYAMYRTQLSADVCLSALVLLHRLKAKFPNATGSAGQRLYLAALMISSKVNNDDTFANSSWHIVARGQFTLKEINQMERELFAHLGYQVTVNESEIDNLSYHLQSFQSALYQTPPSTPSAFKRQKLYYGTAYPSPPPTPIHQRSPLVGYASCSQANPFTQIKSHPLIRS
ncbi:hypothetical protein WALSEDRAFT_60425 [Wallemia mellicola CBS 633.66]|uniref:Cyclin N-terminal domain-containing protein n=1 Tax=Wallemia mellicola (strain ATCC MYA-4683 / CBS 633.66) TaxID=671144 RepID=I4YBT5_WALMC|nr:hypothetical protein WALSEDRAFT_60425 [Wallemia mellicola CBS 633.66]EIM21427.1 hypothetical protein WALSEDRAFT_60425 [Wallemia mellicola CBS 633.66]|eukprot:XP_006958458.1 hypothetical protein WALSEDRAFT_60425 [Wallemia mellicola CBS 633.66]